MNLNLYLENHLAKQLDIYAQKIQRTKNSIIREAIREWLNKNTDKKWSDMIIDFKGIKELSNIDDLCTNLLLPDKDLF